MKPNITPPKKYPWNKGIKINREEYPDMGHFRKHTKEALLKIVEANRKNAKKRGSKFYKDLQKLSIISGKTKGSYKGTLGMRAEKSYRWLGNNAKYNSIHRWIQNHWTKTGICQNCFREIKTEWHNLDGKYNRDKKDTWQEVCRKCHKVLSKGEYGNR